MWWKQQPISFVLLFCDWLLFSSYSPLTNHKARIFLPGFKVSGKAMVPASKVLMFWFRAKEVSILNWPNCVSHGTIKWHGHSKAIKKENCYLCCCCEMNPGQGVLLHECFCTKNTRSLSKPTKRGFGRIWYTDKSFLHFWFVNPIRRHAILQCPLFAF